MERRKVLIVDDDKEFLEELCENLSLNGYLAIEVNDAADAWEVAKRTHPDVIVLDLKMPAKSGFQVADEIKHYQETTHIPIIAMTGYFQEDYVPLMGLFGISKCLKKPFSPLEVIGQIERELEKQGPREDRGRLTE